MEYSVVDYNANVPFADETRQNNEIEGKDLSCGLISKTSRNSFLFSQCNVGNITLPFGCNLSRLFEAQHQSAGGGRADTTRTSGQCGA